VMRGAAFLEAAVSLGAPEDCCDPEAWLAPERPAAGVTGEPADEAAWR